MKRRAYVLLLAAAAAGALAQGKPLPAVNLRAEMRWHSAAEGQRSSAGVTVTTTGNSTSAQTVWRSGSRSTDAQLLQQLTVLNGGTAQARWSQAVPLQWVEAVQGPGPYGGAVVVLRQAWVESATGVWLRPRWPGGSAPVDLDVLAEMPVAAQGPGQSAVGTQVRVPLGEWVTVARSGAQAAQSQRRTLSTRDIDGSLQRELQVRVSLP